MNVRNLTTASVFSAVFIVLNLVCIVLGFGYFGYIDFVVPVFSSIIVLKCNIKNAILSSITSLILIIILLGNIPAAVVRLQSIIIWILLITYFKVTAVIVIGMNLLLDKIYKIKSREEILLDKV